MRRLIVMLAAGAMGAATLAGGGAARDAAATFKCPANAAATPHTLWVKNYKGFRGSTWCNDGATASVTIVSRLASNNKIVGSTKLFFSGGLCTKSKQTGSRFLQFGTRVSPLDKRVPEDPPGLFVNDQTAASGADDYGQIGKAKIKWQENVKFAWKAGTKSGTFSGNESQWDDNNERLLVKASGSFTCVRLVPVL